MKEYILKVCKKMLGKTIPFFCFIRNEHGFSFKKCHVSQRTASSSILHPAVHTLRLNIGPTWGGGGPRAGGRGGGGGGWWGVGVLGVWWCGGWWGGWGGWCGGG